MLRRILFLVIVFKQCALILGQNNPLWQTRCVRGNMVLNECNWCRCKASRYECDVKKCSAVDMFGHFNDAIQDIKVGMEGHGFWREGAMACDPGVQYLRSGLLCVCDETGRWPNAVCRDTFRVLYPVEVMREPTPTAQTCEAGQLYLYGCNVCVCPTSGFIDNDFCTKEKCTDDLPPKPETELQDHEILEYYAHCEPELKYKMGCKNCTCLRNNRLICSTCDGEDKKESTNLCEGKDSVFTDDCNFCLCSGTDFVYCSTKVCLTGKKKEHYQNALRTQFISVKHVNKPIDDHECEPGTKFKKDCNTCWCYESNGIKLLTCSVKQCGASDSIKAIQADCVENTVYKLDCLICSCEIVKGTKLQTCQVNAQCSSNRAVRFIDNDLDSTSGYCEPYHSYKKLCNSCTCLADGKTVKCPTKVCEPEKPLTVQIVPIVKYTNEKCPKGGSYKVGCNLCFCLPNGNAVCTAAVCRRKIN